MRSVSPNLFCLKKFYRTAINPNIRGYQEGKVVEVGIVAYERLRDAHGENRSHLPPQVADRVSFQADKAEFSATLFLRRECQRHQDTNMGHAHC